MAANARSAAKSIIVLNRFKIYVTTLPRESGNFRGITVYLQRAKNSSILQIWNIGIMTEIDGGFAILFGQIGFFA